jgi:hypothetical protein
MLKIFGSYHSILVEMVTGENQPYYLINNENMPPYLISLTSWLTNSKCAIYTVWTKMKTFWKIDEKSGQAVPSANDSVDAVFCHYTHYFQ